jgi:hypothetical protein
MMNDALRKYLSGSEQPITEKALRHILRQEMPQYLAAVSPGSKTKTPKRGAR